MRRTRTVCWSLTWMCRAGIDGGGVFKEFLTELCKEVFDTDRGLWLANKKNELYPNPHSYATESMSYRTRLQAVVLTMYAAMSLAWYRFIGRILGKALYEGILIDVAFAGFFLAKVRRVCRLLNRHTLTNIAVAREAKLPRRPCLARPRALSGAYLPQALRRQPRRSVPQLRCGYGR